MPIQPRPQLPKAKQVASVQATVNAMAGITSAIANGYIDQGKVNTIVSAAIDALRAGE